MESVKGESGKKAAPFTMDEAMRVVALKEANKSWK
jgi:hypothetical protein